MPYYVWTVLAQWPAADRALRCVAYDAVFYWITFVHELYAHYGNIKERLEINSSEQLRLRITVEYNGERKRNPQ